MDTDIPVIDTDPVVADALVEVSVVVGVPALVAAVVVVTSSEDIVTPVVVVSVDVVNSSVVVFCPVVVCVSDAPVGVSISVVVGSFVRPSVEVVSKVVSSVLFTVVGCVASFDVVVTASEVDDSPVVVDMLALLVLIDIDVVAAAVVVGVAVVVADNDGTDNVEMQTHRTTEMCMQCICFKRKKSIISTYKICFSYIT